MLNIASWAGVAQLARASAFQAEGRGFEARLPLQLYGKSVAPLLIGAFGAYPEAFLFLLP